MNMQIDFVMCLAIHMENRFDNENWRKKMLNIIVVNMFNNRCKILLQKVEQYAFVTRLAQLTDHIPVTMTISTL